MPTVSAFLPSPEVSPLGYTVPRRAYSLLHPSGGILRASDEMWLGKEGAQPGPPGRCIPYINVQPPVETSCFPTEYVFRTEHSTWSSILGRKIGTVIIEAQEPSPLKYTSYYASTSSTISLKFQVWGNDIRQIRIKAVEIHPVLCMKQFHSGDRLKGTPRVNQATDGGTLRVSQDVVDLEKHVVSEFQWLKQRKRDSNSPPTYQRASVSEERLQAVFGRASDQGPTRSHTEQLNEQGVEDNSETWITNLKVPVRPQIRLLPSFCSYYNALAYSLIYRVTIVGVYTRSMYLSVPLQVSYPSHEIFSNGAFAADGWSPDPGGESVTTDEACCVSVVSNLGFDHVSSTI